MPLSPRAEAQWPEESVSCTSPVLESRVCPCHGCQGREAGGSAAHQPSLLLQGEAWAAVQCVGALHLEELTRAGTPTPQQRPRTGEICIPWETILALDEAEVWTAGRADLQNVNGSGVLGSTCE